MTEQPTTKSTELAHRARGRLDVRLAWFPGHGDDKAVLASSRMRAVGSYPACSDEAELAQLLLWAAGIPYEIDAGDAGVSHPSNRAGDVRLLVEDRDADPARWALTYRP